MRSAFLALLIVALVLTGLGVYGVADYVKTRDAWKAVMRDAATDEAPPGTLANAYQDYVRSLDRSRNLGFGFSLLSLAAGLGLGAWASSTYLKNQHPAGSTVVCSICGTPLTARQAARGLCDPCLRRAT